MNFMRIGFKKENEVNVHFSSKTDLWATPQVFFDELDKRGSCF